MNSGEFTIIIYETDIVFLAIKRINGRTPHIKKKVPMERMND
jgi:hypothetical protein